MSGTSSWYVFHESDLQAGGIVGGLLYSPLLINCVRLGYLTLVNLSFFIFELRIVKSRFEWLLWGLNKVYMVGG